MRRDYLSQPVTERDNPVPPSGSVVTKIIMVTVGVFLLQLLTKTPEGSSTVSDWLAIERDLVFRSGQVWRLLTYAFCHSELQLMHIICNMVALLVLGRIVARTLGHREFVAVYLAAAVFSGLIQVSSLAVFREESPVWVIGASGAVSAIFMLFALHYPRLKLYLFGIIPIETRWLLAIMVTYDGLGFLGLVPAVFLPAGTNVGHAAHLGGLLFGLLYFRWNMNFTRWWERFSGRVPRSERPRQNLRIYNPETQPVVDYSDQVDAILVKISRTGEASLTPRERRILTHASAQLKNSR